MALVVSRLMVQVGGDTSEATGALGSLSSSLSAFSTGAAAVVTEAASAIVDLGVKTVSMAGDFQQGLSTLVTGAGESQDNLGIVSDGIQKIATDTGTTTKQLVDGMYMIESAGHSGADGLDVLQASAEGAKESNAKLKDVANGVTTIMTDYASKNYTAVQATNALVVTVSAGKTTMAELSKAMASIAPTASAAGVGLYDMEGAMATMTGEGVPAAQAATYLRQTILALDAPSKQTKDALAAVGLTSQEVSDRMKESLPDTLQMITDAVGKKFPVGSAQYIEALKNIAGGSKQMQGILDLTGDHMKTFADNTNKIGGAVVTAGTDVQGWAVTQANFNTQMDRAREVVEVLGIKIGTALLPVFTNLVEFFTTNMLPVLDKFSGFVSTNVGPILDKLDQFIQNTLVPTLGKLADFFVNKVVPAIGQMVSWFADHVMPVVGTFIGVVQNNVIPALASIGGTIFNQLIPALQGLWDKIAPILIPTFQTLGHVLQDYIAPILNALVNVFSAIVTGISTLIGWIEDVIGWFGKMGQAASDALNNVKQGVNNIPVIGGIANWAGFAEGTDFVQNSGVYTVGEKGPELVYLPRGAQVIPNSALQQTGAANAQSTGSSAGAGNQNVYLQIDGKTFARLVLPYLTDAIRLHTGLRI